MRRSLFAVASSAGLFVLAMTLALATPVAAQTGGIRGKVVDEADKPAPDVQITISSPEGLGGATLKTDSKGEFFRIGMIPGNYTIKASKGSLSASRAIHIGIGDPTAVDTLTLRAGGASVSGGGDSSAAAKKQAELQNTFKEARSLTDAGKYDEAIAAYTKVAAGLTKCPQCYIGIGDVYAKKGTPEDVKAAEDAYKKAIEVDPTSHDGYSSLATFYNTQ